MADEGNPSAPPRSLAALRRAIDACRDCDLYRNATQAVPGAGAAHAPIMLVGEQPGDQEDLQGLPFVGPAGKLLDRALEASGIDRAQVFVTNAVKHFSWIPRGRRRLHKKPTDRQIAACLDWLQSEIRLVKPRIIVCLGATAAQALLGPHVRVLRDRGRFVASPLPAKVLVTVHPSSILRGAPEEREASFAQLVADLRHVHDA